MKKNNISIISGNLGNDPERLASKNGKMITNFSVAVNNGYFDKEQNNYITTHTNWIPVSAFDNLSELSGSSLKKGDAVSIIGEIKTSSYTDRDGIKRTGFEIIASDIKKLHPLQKDDNFKNFTPPRANNTERVKNFVKN